MSEKFSARNSCSFSPLRSNAHLGRGVTSNRTTSKRGSGARKPGEKVIEEEKNREGCREEFGTTALNLTLVGSPAPRSQVRALVSSTNVAPKPKAKASYGSKSREQNPHEICMEKLYQFADNPTKFVRLENAEEPRLHLDLEFSDRSEESENFYDSHNIAFGENGEYRIPEYDHIRFLQFSIGNNQDPGITEDRDNSAFVKCDRSTAACPESIDTAINSEPFCERFPKGDHISTMSGSPGTPTSPPAIGSLDLSDGGPPPQSYPLGSAINYKNNINPEVERFMLDTGPESVDDNYTGSTQNNRLLNESILSKSFAQAVRLQPFGGSVENSARTSPVTGRTTLSQASSGDGTWHVHSLNSPYFASTESNSWSDSKRNVAKELSKILASYEETEEYLTIVKNEEDSGPTSERGAGIEKYIFITNELPGSGSNVQSSSESEGDDGRGASSLRRSSVEESDRNSSTRNSIRKIESDNVSSGESLSDYCLGNIFTRSSSSYTRNSSSSSSSTSVEDVKTGRLATPRDSLENERKAPEERSYVDENKSGAPETKNLTTSEGNLSSKVLYMTMEEVNLAADHTNKLSQIFNRVLKRSKCENLATNSENANANRSSSTSITSRNTSKLIYTCLASPNFCTSHLSS